MNSDEAKIPVYLTVMKYRHILAHCDLPQMTKVTNTDMFARVQSEITSLSTIEQKRKRTVPCTACFKKKNLHPLLDDLLELVVKD